MNALGRTEVESDTPVASASTAAGDAEFRQCIARFAKKAVFARTADGITISYPIVLR